MKATAIAPANIAFIKYWGKADVKRNLPLNTSISMNLSACMTTTTVEEAEEDWVTGGIDKARVIAHLDRIRMLARTNVRLKVTTANAFPASAGIASSASGFAALTVAACAAVGLQLNERKLSALARLGSGSAARSIPDGFVKWEGETAHSLYPPDHWDIRDIIVLVDAMPKAVSSTRGHELAPTSPHFSRRQRELPARIKGLEAALAAKDFRRFGEIVEEDCLDMHRVMQTQTPPLLYWSEVTTRIAADVQKRTIPAYMTVDAGPNVHILCEAKDEKRVIERYGNYTLIVNRPAKGARLI